jgi:hypothetical protein
LKLFLMEKEMTIPKLLSIWWVLLKNLLKKEDLSNDHEPYKFISLIFLLSL